MMFRFPSIRWRMLAYSLCPVLLFGVLLLVGLSQTMYSRMVADLDIHIRLLTDKHRGLMDAAFSRTYVLFQELRTLGETWNYARMFDNWQAVDEALNQYAQKKALEIQRASAFSRILALSTKDQEVHSGLGRDTSGDLPEGVLQRIRSGTTGVQFDEDLQTFVYTMTISTRGGEEIRVAAILNPNMIREILDGLSREIGANGLIRHSVYMVTRRTVFQSGAAPILPSADDAPSPLQQTGEGYSSSMQADMPDRSRALIGCWFPQTVIQEAVNADLGKISGILLLLILAIAGTTYYLMLIGILRPLGNLRGQIRKFLESDEEIFQPVSTDVAELDFLAMEFAGSIRIRHQANHRHHEASGKELVQAHKKIADLELGSRRFSLRYSRINRAGCFAPSAADPALVEFGGQEVASWISRSPVEKELIQFWLGMALEHEGLLVRIREFLPQKMEFDGATYQVQWENSDDTEAPVLIILRPFEDSSTRPEDPAQEQMLRIVQNYGRFRSFCRDVIQGLEESTTNSRFWLSLASQAAWFKASDLAGRLKDLASVGGDTTLSASLALEARNSLNQLMQSIGGVLGHPIEDQWSAELRFQRFCDWLGAQESEAFAHKSMREGAEIQRLGTTYSRIFERWATYHDRLLSPMDVRGLSALGTIASARSLLTSLGPWVGRTITHSLRSPQMRLKAGLEEAGRIEFRVNPSPLSLALADDGEGLSNAQKQEALNFLLPFLRRAGGTLNQEPSQPGPGKRFEVQFDPFLS